MIVAAMGGDVPVLFDQQNRPSPFDLGLRQPLADRFHSVGAHKDGDGLPFFIAHGNRYGSHHLIRRHRRLINLSDIRPPMLRYSLVPAAVLETLAEHFRLRWIDRAHPAVEVVDAYEGKI